MLPQYTIVFNKIMAKYSKGQWNIKQNMEKMSKNCYFDIFVLNMGYQLVIIRMVNFKRNLF